MNITALLGVSKREGSALRKGPFLTLRIMPSQPGNLPIMAKKPATDSTRAQGRRESANPSRSDVKPPSVLQPALSWVLDTPRTSLF